MTPLEEFKKLLPERYSDLTEEQLITMRDLIDLQADMILDSYIQVKADGAKEISKQ